MYNYVLSLLVLSSPLIFQVQTTPTAIPSSDPLGDTIKIILGLILMAITPTIISRLNALRQSVDEFRKASTKNTESVASLDTSILNITQRVTQLEGDLSRAIKERDDAKAVALIVQAAADAARESYDIQIKILVERNTKLNADINTERVINSELAGNIRELRQDVVKLKERCELLESAGPIADAIAAQLVKMNSST